MPKASSHLQLRVVIRDIWVVEWGSRVVLGKTNQTSEI